MRTGCSHKAGQTTAPGRKGLLPGPAPPAGGGRRAAQQTRWCPGFESSGFWRRRTLSILRPWNVPRGCSLAAGYRFWERSAKRMDSESPPQNPPRSTFLQVVDKNSRRITLGEERDARQARRGEATSGPAQWRAEEGCNPAPGRGAWVHGEARTSASGGGEVEDAPLRRTPAEPSAPHTRRPATSRRLLYPMPGPPAPGTGWGQKG